MRTNVRITGACLALLLAATAIPALGAEGRIPVWQYPTSITAPGKYIVTRDIYGGGGIPIITIASSDVDLDINGFTLDQTAPGGAPVIEIIGDVDTFELDVIIRNGILVNGTYSIERNNLAGNFFGDRVVIEDIQSRDAMLSAIHLWSINEVAIRRANIVDAHNHGIHLDRTAGFTNGMIEHCAIRLTAGSWDGIHVDRGSAFAVRHNRIETPSLHGIHVSGPDEGQGCVACLIGENTISDADGNGIFLERSDGTKVYNNVVSRGETNGIYVDRESADNLLLDNVVRQSGFGGVPWPGPGAGGSGIVIDGTRNYLEGNTANDNDACGLLFNAFPTSGANTFGRNMARGNDPSGSGNCGQPTGCAGLFPPDSCDMGGVGNDTRGDNMIPGPPPF